MQKGQIKWAITQRDGYWSPIIFVFFKFVLSTDFNDILLKKILIQQHWGVGYLKHLAVGPNIYLWTGHVSTGCSLVSLLYFLIIFQQYNWICHRTTACFLLRKVVYLMFQNIHLIGGEVFIDLWLSVWRCRVIRRSPFIMKKNSEWSSIIMWKRGKKLECIFFEFDFVPLKKPSCPSWIKVVYFHTCSQILNNWATRSSGSSKFCHYFYFNL